METESYILSFFFFLSCSAPLAAIEISLEQNKLEHGAMGYVDMQKVFKSFPETIRAKETFDEIVEATEEKINLKRAELLRLRNEIEELRIERDFIIKKSAIVIPGGKKGPRKAAAPPRSPPRPATAVSSAAAVSTASHTVSAPLPGLGGVSPAAIAASSASAASHTQAAGSSAPPSSAPAVSSAPLAAPSIAASSSPIAAASIAASSAPAISSAPASTGAVAALPPLPAADAADPALAKIDQETNLKTIELARKEAAFKAYEKKAEGTLLRLEGRKTEVLLGKIYSALRELAREEGISVVVDKKEILYGHRAVDLTDKLIERLKALKKRNPWKT